MRGVVITKVFVWPFNMGRDLYHVVIHSNVPAIVPH